MLPHGALRHAASQLLAPTAPFVLPAAQALVVVQAAWELARQLPGAPAEGHAA